MNDNRIIIRFMTSGVLVLSTKAKGTFAFDHCAVNEGRLSKDVCDRIRSLTVRKKAELVVVLPQRQAIYKYYSLPTKNKDELRRMVDLQAGRGLPFPAQEIVYQMSPAGTDAQGLTRVVVAIARQKMVQECLDVVSASGLNPSRCALSAFGVAAWHAHRFPADTDQWVLVVDADTDGIEFCLCKNKQLLFARGMAVSDVPSDVILQIDLTLEALRSAYPDAQLSKVILTGIKDHWGLIKEALARNVQVPCHEVPVQDSAGNGAAADHPSQGSVCSLVGMAYAADTGPDLMPSSVHQGKHSRNEVLALLRMFAAMLFCAGAVMFWAHQRVERQEDALRELRQKIAQNKSEYEQARRNLKLFEFLLKDRSQKVVIAELFKEIYQALPSSVVLMNVQYSDGDLTVLGQTRESGDVGAFQKAMMNSPVFKDVTLAYANRPQRLAMEYTEFKIVCRTRASKGAEL